MPTHRGRELVKKTMEITTSSPGRFSLALGDKAKAREKRPGDEVVEITVFKDPKDRQVKHHPNKKALTLSIGSGSRVQRNQQSFFQVHRICTYEKSFLPT